MDYGEAFEAAGTFGRAQYLIIAIYMVSSVYNGLQGTIPVFIAIKVPFYCADVSPHNTTTFSNNSLSDYDFLPYKVRDSFTTHNNKSNEDYDSKCVDGCQKYVYKPGLSSIKADFDLACGSGPFLASFSTSAYWLAFLVACLTVGHLGDRWGRKITSAVLLFFYMLIVGVTPFAPSIILFIIFRFITGFLHGGFTVLTFVVMVETINKKYLPQMGVVSLVTFAMGGALTALISYLFQTSWRWQFATLVFPLIPYLLIFVLLLPESPLWLHSNKKYAKAEKVLRWMAKINKKDFSIITLEKNVDPKIKNSNSTEIIICNESEEFIDNDSAKFMEKVEILEEKHTVLSLFVTFRTAMLSFSHFFAWFSISFVFYGLSYDVGDLGGDIYVDTFLLNLSEIPASIVCLAIDKFGRKPTLLFCLLVSSTACLILPFTEPIAEGHLKIGLALIGKCTCSGAFNLVYTYTSELFPTVLRSTGLAWSSAAARTGAILAPFIVDVHVGPYNCLAFIIFTALGYISSVIIILYSLETLGKPFLTTAQHFRLAAHLGFIPNSFEDELQESIEEENYNPEDLEDKEEVRS